MTADNGRTFDVFIQILTISAAELEQPGAASALRTNAVKAGDYSSSQLQLAVKQLTIDLKSWCATAGHNTFDEMVKLLRRKPLWCLSTIEDWYSSIQRLDIGNMQVLQT